MSETYCACVEYPWTEGVEADVDGCTGLQDVLMAIEATDDRIANLMAGPYTIYCLVLRCRLIFSFCSNRDATSPSPPPPFLSFYTHPPHSLSPSLPITSLTHIHANALTNHHILPPLFFPLTANTILHTHRNAPKFPSPAHKSAPLNKPTSKRGMGVQSYTIPRIRGESSSNSTKTKHKMYRHRFWRTTRNRIRKSRCGVHCNRNRTENRSV